MKEIRLGTIGTGNIVHWVLDEALQMDQVYLEAVYSRSFASGDALARSYGAEKVYTNLEDLLSDPDVNTIYVASPNIFHFKHAKAALEHGKHVICEKPFCTRAAQVTELTELAREKGVFLVDATPTVFLPNFTVIREHLPELGPVRMVMCNYSQYSSRYEQLKAASSPDEIPNVFSPAYAGGSLMDINYYNVYFCISLFGIPEKSCYYPNLASNGIDTSGILMLTYPGFVCTCIGAKDTWGINLVQIEGEKGFLYGENGANCLDLVKVVTHQDQAEYNKQDDPSFKKTDHPSRWHYEMKSLIPLLLSDRYDQIFRQLETTAAVIQVIEEARKEAGILFPGDALV